MGLAGAGALAPSSWPVLGAAGPLFEEVPASASGIAWKHDNAMSVSRYLPETMGPGVAFLDFDHDGRKGLVGEAREENGRSLVQFKWGLGEQGWRPVLEMRSAFRRNRKRLAAIAVIGRKR